MIQLAPSILSADFANLEKEIKRVEEAGCDMLHIDVMDGHFVPNITLGPPIIKSLRSKTQLPFDVHLMIENPDQYIEQFIDAGADIVTVHSETCLHLHRTIQLIKGHGVKAGVALNPATPLMMIENILEELDMVLIMSVNPGFGGQAFIPNMLEKISRLKSMIDKKGLQIDIQVDGGVKAENIKAVTEAGANIIVAGSAIFNSTDIHVAVQQLKMNASSDQ